MNIAYFDCFAGISGDMSLAALLDAGVEPKALEQELEKLRLPGWHLHSQRVVKRGISAQDVTIHIEGQGSHEHHHHHHAAGKEHAHEHAHPHSPDHPHAHSHEHDQNHSHSHEHKHEHEHGHGHGPSHPHAHGHGRGFVEIRQMIESSTLAPRVKERSILVFRRLGEAEAKIHSVALEQIHFHEVGAVDSIVDIVGVCIGLELLGIERVLASPVPTFHGRVNMDHGLYPLPAPATLELLKGIPWSELGLQGELVTPTGAALLAALADSFGPPPAMRVKSIGYGAGKKDFGIPNVLRLLIGELASQAAESTTVLLLECNIDDMNPQLYDVAMEKLTAAGALDVYMTPIQMKKNRPATLLSVLCAAEQRERLCQILFRETSTLGIRMQQLDRLCLPRELRSVVTPYGEIRIKIARLGSDIVNAQPEFEDCRRAALEHDVPVKQVREAALASYHRQT